LALPRQNFLNSICLFWFLTPYISLTGNENIFWANQNVFFLATLFPLLTFAVFFLDENNSHTFRTNLVATMLGALSTLSMASGLAVPFFLSIAFLLVFRNYLFAVFNFMTGVFNLLFLSKRNERHY
jgi:hypothetical protein